MSVFDTVNITNRQKFLTWLRQRFGEFELEEMLDSDLIAIAALTTTSFGRSLLTQANAAAARVTIGVVNASGGGVVGDNATADIGGAVGFNATADGGGAVGNGAGTSGGGAVGENTSATSGGAVGAAATATSGGAVGDYASATSGGAVGQNASATTGGAVGFYASATTGFAGGVGAIETAGGVNLTSDGVGSTYAGTGLALNGIEIANIDGNITGPTLRSTATAPASNAAGVAGQMIFTNTHTFRCYASGDWRRVAVTYATY